MSAITISRQYGSGGRKVALRVSEILGWSLFDKRLMMNVARDLGLSKDDIVDFTEDDYKVTSFWDRLFRYGGFSDPTGAHHMIMTNEAINAFTTAEMDEDAAVRLVNKAIQMAHARGNVVIVGRGGQALLQDKRDVFHVRVQAPMAMRKQRLVAYEEIDQDEAESIAIQRDEAGKKYMKRFFDVAWDDPELYHMVINSEKLDIEAIAQIIVTTAKQVLAVKEA